MGLTDHEFGQLTPALFDALLKRKEQADRLGYIHAGIIAAAVINFSMGAPEKKVEPMDFVPMRPEERESVDITKMTPDEQAAYVLNQMRKKVYRRK